MKLALPKLKAILLYFANNTDPRFLGKVKLMKLFYFLDFSHVKQYGVPVTFDNYVHLDHGPIPSEIKNIIDDTAENPEHSMVSDVIKIKKVEGVEMFRILPLREFTEDDKKHFSNYELETLRRVCLKFGSKNTAEIEEESHNEAPWKETRILEHIPYKLAARDKDSRVTEEEVDMLLSL